MRFTRLRLNGFKSFVDPTDLVIHEGLTGVVGPNGCGKSNLLEALRWVMGETRPTAMRGDGMEDVIFAGAATRNARNFAEVSLTIDNSERLAPSGFNDADQLEIIRRITRDAGSAYKVNIKDVRARDVQMLFADASTGSTSPALVRQGQISELINAKPKNRRRILEEAAGISGLYQRRHEAELRLSAAETNLTRVDDVVEGLAAQLATLTRQAKQAARYREIGEALRRAENMLLWRRWREADSLRTAAEEGLSACARTAAQSEQAARAASERRAAAERGLPALREEEAIASAILQRLIVGRDGLADEERRARQTIETLAARLLQIERDTERETALNRDAGETMARLEAEQAEILQAADGHDARLADATERAREASAALGDREGAMQGLTEDMARLSARHQSAQRMLADARAGLAKAEQARETARRAETETAGAGARAAEALEAATIAAEDAQSAAEEAEERLIAAEETRAEIQSREAGARAQRSGAEGEANALRAEVTALARLVEREAKAGTQLLDKVRVETGFEAALGAALADDLRAPVVGGDQPSGWVALAAYSVPQRLPDGVEPLSNHVDVPLALGRRIGQIGIVTRAEGAARQADLKPGQRLVSLEGDLWRWDGLRAAAEDAPSAAALRLRQLNRLVELKRDLEDAAARAAGAGQAHEHLTRALAEATRADAAARDARREADRRVAEASRAQSRAEADRSVAGGRQESARIARARAEEEVEETRARLDEAAAATEELPDLDATRQALEALRQQVEGARIAMMSRRAQADEIRREGEARARRRQDIGKEISGWRQRLETAGKRAQELSERRDETAEALDEARAAPEEIAIRREDLAEEIAGAEARRAAATTALQAAETALRAAQDAERDAERAGGEAREARARAEARAEAARETVAAAAERIRDETELLPLELLAALGTDPETMPDAEALDAEVTRLRRARDGLGAVNLRAEEDAKAVAEEHGGLVTEKADLEEAIRKLRSGIAGLNREGRERLLTAFEQVNASFRTLFTHLFGGGEANLVLVESDDPLEAGLEIMCQPPGKKLATLSLLSGGEQTLTALALIFAVFLANPAPICVLDEVDAPLDDANVTRFCDLLDEMTRRTDTRFLIITHHAVTMSRMDRLFGVTMQEQGVSQLVSVDLKRAEALVA
ncbi:chromosome segregation protein SMC [Frigidibacter sp. MR17.24]|uniref:chromosome segregation protein SMC n=1 Tax=Frigidibacter sp. MR17.24 TaxID=3127345 RepID=UPI003012F4D0